MPDPSSDLDALFCAAIELRTPEARAEYLNGACGADPDLRRQVESLVAAHFRAGSFLDHSPPAGPTAAWVGPEGPGTVIGPYKLLEQIGEGGFGVVYVAEQTAPVKRRVALKVIKPGMDSKQVVARFEAERQALALMDHPNIATILDGGTTDHGRPYFVMELVRGLPITDYCDRAGLPPRDRLRLFATVCRAVQHAHQKGVIHRDLKPANVLVTLHDGTPVPKVIDFGVAKAIGRPLTDRSVYTRFAQLVGTPLYMAPEQAELSGLDVDTRADVYGLGVLLYELLTGTTPFDPEAVRKAGLDEVRRMIREDEPPRPSRRLSTLAAEARSTVSGRRGLDERRLVRLVRGDLDWVAMRCLEKDRNRRYDGAGALAADVERYLADEPVEARPPTAWYRLRKAARRNRAALLTAGVVAAALVAGTAASVWQAVRATDARHRAEAAERRATEEAEIAKAVNEFLQHDLLLQVRQDVQVEGGFSPTPDLTVREALNRAAGRIGDRFRDRPLLEAAIRRTIGVSYQNIGENKQAVPHLERAVDLYRGHLGPDHPVTLDTLYDLAMPYQFTGRLPDAISLLEQVHARRRDVFGPDHPTTLRTLNSLGEACRKAGQLDRARDLIGQARERKLAVLGPDDESTINSTHDLGLVYRDLGRLPEAAACLEEATRRLDAMWGARHPDARYSRMNLIEVYERLGRFEAAAAQLRAAIRVDDPRDPAHARQLRRSLGRNLLCLRKYAEAETVLRKCLAEWEASSPDDWERFDVMSLLGGTLLGQKRYADAEPLLLKGYAGLTDRGPRMPPKHQGRVNEAAGRMAELYEATNRPEEARELRAKLAAGK